MVSSSYGPVALLIAATVLLCVAASEETIAVDRAAVRISYAGEAERLTRSSFSADGPDLSASSSSSSKAIVDSGDTLHAQLSCVGSESGDTAHPQQAFLRFVRHDTGADTVYVMQRKSIGMRVELSMKKEIRQDLNFWSPDVSYRVEVIVGDTKMASGSTWVAIAEMKFSSAGANVFKAPAAEVFDFDVGVKKALLPEFTSPLPPEEKQATAAAIIVALIALLAPLPLVILAWARLGVFPMKVSGGASGRSSAFKFEICLLLHMAALTMFWLKWNILQTWKVMAALMPATIVYGQRTLSVATRSVAAKQTGKLEKDE